MKNDTTSTFLNFALAALVILGVVFALMTIWRTSHLRQMQLSLQTQMQRSQVASMRAQQLLQDAAAYNATAKNQELAQILLAAQTPAQAPAAK
jgi:hypothetical protein